jgi:hypothetical protein
VRSVGVGRSVASVQPTNRNRIQANNIEAVFAGFGGASTESVDVKPPVEQTPVISETESSFTVTLEFIEIILPSNSVENPV